MEQKNGAGTETYPYRRLTVIEQKYNSIKIIKSNRTI